MPALHKMHLRGGRFHKTSRADLREVFANFASSGSRTLVVHFHGGLVRENQADRIAERLLPDYQDGGAYPLFVIWRRSILETLRDNWRDIVCNDLFEPLVDWITQFSTGKLDQGREFADS